MKEEKKAESEKEGMKLRKARERLGKDNINIR